jgi:hypothetical protein
MPLYFAPEIPRSVLSDALSSLSDSAFGSERCVLLVMSMIDSGWCIASPNFVYLSPNTKIPKRSIRELNINLVGDQALLELFLNTIHWGTEMGEASLSNGGYRWKFGSSDFADSNQIERVLSRLRYPYDSEMEPHLRVLSYDAESNSYWIQHLMGDSTEFEWCADYPFTENVIGRTLQVSPLRIVGDRDLLARFQLEAQMDVIVVMTEAISQKIEL